jgi:V/A-type H+-transporting ATPase subunit C
MELQTGFLERIKNGEKKQGFFSKINFKQKKTSGYAYTNTRVRVMKTKLLGKNDFQKMMNMSFPEIARYMQETEYNKEISLLAASYDNANLIEYSLNKNLENTFNKIIAFSIKASEEQVKLYLKKFDILNIKTFLRGKFSEQRDDTIISQLVCAGSLDKKFFENAIKKSSCLEEAAMQLKGMEYFNIVKKFKNNLSKMEDELDKHYYKSVLEKAEPELAAFLADEIKVKNTLNRLRAQKTGIKMEKIENESAIKLALPKTEDCIENRIFLKKFLLERGNKMAREFKRNVRPVLGYLIAKENEISNIRIIVRGKNSNLPLNLIEQQLVM